MWGILGIILAGLTILSKSWKKTDTKTRLLSTILKVFTTISFALFAFAGVDKGLEIIIAYGLIVCALGDLFMEYENTFMLGMLSFLVGQILYISGFLRTYEMNGWDKLLYFVLILTGGLCYYFFGLLKSLGKDKIPVLVYLIAICTMLWSTIPSMSSATAGALLFVISDSLLAYDKYVGRIKNRDFLVLSTYFIGQFLIAWSVVVC
ncbi:MAG TPA: lysoplasmalogenase [Fervidobacterium sp.]|nr:hypothetical protein [Fervidobacterium sp.]HOK88310.1 lysoplasmalogenase [Fervidobacterium sp.]HOM74791.1 lysoplasmalogenase [Fervidobacterium sp.]HOQ40273.1 lysoplasmalogenase [Fervidobacterium sp.]HPP18310.1 lysoplasmalogenase [Fervidobacterium sp.]